MNVVLENFISALHFKESHLISRLDLMYVLTNMANIYFATNRCDGYLYLWQPEAQRITCVKYSVDSCFCIAGDELIEDTQIGDDQGVMVMSWKQM